MPSTAKPAPSPEFISHQKLPTEGLPSSTQQTNRLIPFSFAVLAIYTVCVYGSMAMMSLGAAAIVLLSLVSFFSTRSTPFIPNNPMMWPSAFLGLACAWSLVWVSLTGFQYYGTTVEVSWLEDLRKLWHLGFPFLLMPLLLQQSASRQEQLYRLWLAAGALSGALGVVQHFFPVFHPQALPEPGMQHRFHATGLAGFHLSYAAIMSFPTAAFLAHTLMRWRTKHTQYGSWPFLLVGLSLCLASGYLTFSKIHWLVLPTLLFFFAWIGLPAIGRLISFCALAGGLGYFASLSEVRHRFMAVESLNDRWNLWRANGDMIRHSPWFGVGWHHNSELSGVYFQNRGTNDLFETYHRVFQSHAHNNLLDQWSSTGTFGALMWIWWCAAILVISRRLFRGRWSRLSSTAGLAFFAGWIGLHLDGLSQTCFWDAKVMHQTGWVTAMTLAWWYRQKTQPSRGENTSS